MGKSAGSKAGGGGGGGGRGKSTGGGVVEKTEWTTPKGFKVEYEAKILTEKTVNLDGDRITSPTLEFQETFRLNGAPISGQLEPLTPAQQQKMPGYTHRYGNVPLTQAQADKITTLRSKVRSTPAYAKRQREIADTIAKNKREIAAYDKAIKGVRGGYEDKNTY
jgi:hypothetical protein